jgi:hypothetical protein
MGECTPEVTLRSPYVFPSSSGFSLPSWGTYVNNKGRRASAISRNLQDNTYYLIILDFSDSPIPRWGCDSTLAENKLASSSSSSSLSISSAQSVKLHHQQKRETSQEDQQSSLRTSHTNFLSYTQKIAFKPNCRPSSCSPDAIGDCEETKCWGLGGQGGFYCCAHPPT